MNSCADLSADDAIRIFLDERLSAVPPGPYEMISEKLYLRSNVASSWLQTARLALRLGTKEVAARLGISPGTYKKLEASEQLGTISIEKLVQAANAMDCEIVLGLRPRSRKIFSELLFERWKELAETKTEADLPEDIRQRKIAQQMIYLFKKSKP